MLWSGGSFNERVTSRQVAEQLSLGWHRVVEAGVTRAAVVDIF